MVALLAVAGRIPVPLMCGAWRPFGAGFAADCAWVTGVGSRGLAAAVGTTGVAVFTGNLAGLLGDLDGRAAAVGGWRAGAAAMAAAGAAAIGAAGRAATGATGAWVTGATGVLATGAARAAARGAAGAEATDTAGAAATDTAGAGDATPAPLVACARGPD
jgi:hypothetical protein